MMKKTLLAPLFTLTVVSCSVPFSALLNRAPTPTALKDMLTGQIDGGYTKKTTISDFVCENEEYFHCKVNGAQRATYYRADETALLMGNYDGTFSSINSGYMNNETGIQHFTYKLSLGFFDNIDLDWTYDGQSVGDYYPTLTSLANLVVVEDWSYQNNAWHYDGNDAVVYGKFQYFAAPLLLEGNIVMDGIEVGLDGDVLSIKLYGDSSKLISEALITKGIN